MNLEFLKTLNVKKCMLKIQLIMLKKLTTEKNQLKKLVEIFKLVILNFDEQIKKIKKTLPMLKY